MQLVYSYVCSSQKSISSLTALVITYMINVKLYGTYNYNTMANLYFIIVIVIIMLLKYAIPIISMNKLKLSYMLDILISTAQ